MAILTRLVERDRAVNQVLPVNKFEEQSEEVPSFSPRLQIHALNGHNNNHTYKLGTRPN